MPVDAWLLLVASVGLGLGIEVVYMRARLRGKKPSSGGASAPASQEPDGPSRETSA